MTATYTSEESRAHTALIAPFFILPVDRPAFIRAALGYDHALLLGTDYSGDAQVCATNFLAALYARFPEQYEKVIAYAKQHLKPVDPIARVFLSYARKDDEAFVQKLYDDLTKRGISIWYDRLSMPSRGETFDHEIQRAIEGVDRVILVAGEHALTSDYVWMEWKYALSHCKAVIPLLRGITPERLPEPLRGLHAPEGGTQRPYEDTLAELLRLLGDHPLPLGALKGTIPPHLPSTYIERSMYLTPLIADVCGTNGGRQMTAITSKQIVGVTGLGGIGKTTLAHAVCHDCSIRRRFPDGIIWVEVGRTAQPTTIMAAVGRGLGDDPTQYTESTAQERLQAISSGKRALVVLDDVWDHTMVTPFAILGAANRVLLTTRQPGITTKIGAGVHALDKLSEAEGLALIDAHLNRSPDDTRPYTEAERAILQTLDYHTLAVQIAALRLKERGADFAPTLLERLKSPRLFKDLAIDETDKNLNVEMSLFESYDEMKADARRRFRAVSVFAAEGTFSAGALGAVWGDGDAADADDGIDALRRAGLLADAGEGRYSLHPLLRAYAQALAQKEGEWAALQGGHFAHYAALYGGKEAMALTAQLGTLDRDFPDLQAALLWGFQTIPVPAVDLLTALDNGYMQFRQLAVVRRGLLTAGYEGAEKGGYALGQANTLQALGDLEVREAHYGEARARYEAALRLFEAIPARLGQANTLKALGDLERMEDHYGEARARYTEAMALFRVIPDSVGIMNTLIGLARLEKAQGNRDAAARYYEEVIKLAESIPAFANHSVVNGWRSEYQTLMGGDDPNTLLQQLFNAFQTVQSSDQMRQLVVQLPIELLDVLEQIVDSLITQHPPEATAGIRERSDDLRTIRKDLGK